MKIISIALVVLLCSCAEDDCYGPDTMLRVTARDLGGDCSPDLVASWLTTIEDPEFVQGSGEACGSIDERNIYTTPSGDCVFEFDNHIVTDSDGVTNTIRIHADKTIAANAFCLIACTHRIEVRETQ